jgi:hypothetical protein
MDAGAVSQRAKRQRREDGHLDVVSTLGTVELYLNSPLNLHDLELNNFNLSFYRFLVIQSYILP